MKTIFAFLLITISLSAQERVLLHINRNGLQEAIPLKKGERAQDVIRRIENEKTSLLNPNKPAGLIDTLKYYPNEGSLTTNFGFTHQDIALQWYTPAAGGIVKEFWWRNFEKGGTIRKATVRAWRVNPKLSMLPIAAVTKFLGYYKDPTDGDGYVTPFKPENGDQWFYGNGKSDSSTWRFDPLGTEVSGLKGGVQVTLDSNQWQGIAFDDYGDTIAVSLGEMFGFTLSNDTRKNDLLTEADERMEILSYANPNPAPYHSYKWYEGGRNTPGVDNGWHMRGDYEWGMYVVFEYISIPFTGMHVGTYGTMVNPGPREICGTIRDDNPGGSDTIPVLAFLKYKFGTVSQYDSIRMMGKGSTLCATIPTAQPGDTVFWWVFYTDRFGNRTSLSPRNYKVFKKTQDRLFVINNAAFSLTTAKLIYLSNSNSYDSWSAPNDGTGELSELFAMYDKIVLVDGSYPSRDVYTALKTWIGTGSSTSKKNLFFSSQDYGCYIQPVCSDTTFPTGSFEEKYLGVKTLGPQDQGPTNRPVQIIPQSDTVTNYIIKYNADSATTLWHHPTYELGFAAYPDFMTPIASSKPIFKDASGQNVYAVRNAGTNFNTMFMALDAGSLQFRSDTSISNAANDPKYRWIVDVKSLANVFLDVVTNVQTENTKLPLIYSLQQNYPNPFNPTTTIEYSVAGRSHVTIAIYNILGQKVATVVNETKDAGSHSISFNAQSLASGLYFYEMQAHQKKGGQAGRFVSVKKMLLMK